MLEDKLPVIFEVYANINMHELNDLLESLDCELITDWSTKFIRNDRPTIVYQILIPNVNKARTYVNLMRHELVYGMWVLKNKELTHFHPEHD